MKNDHICCDLLKTQLDAMELILKSMRMITKSFEHSEMLDGINEIEHGLIELFEQVETVQEISEGVYKVIEKQ